MDVEVISDVKAFLDLEGAWNALAAHHATPLLHHEWFAAAFDAFGRGCDLAIHVARERGRLRAIAPFVIERGLMSRLALLGHQTMEPGGMLYDDDDALQAVLHRLRSWRLPVFAPRLAQGSAEVRALLSGRAWPLRLPQRLRSTASVPLDPDWPAFEARMSKQSRTYIRRKRKFAEREGALRFEAAMPREAEVEHHLSEFIRVEGAGWKSREGTSLRCDTQRLRFYTTYARAAARGAMLRMFFLRCGPDTMAARMALEYGGRLWELKIGYDEKFSACSPGILLTHETLRWACERRLSSHEFLGSAEPWQHWWPFELRHYQSARLFPFSVSGCVALGQDASRMLVRRFAVSSGGPRRRTPPAVAHEAVRVGSSQTPRRNIDAQPVDGAGQHQTNQRARTSPEPKTERVAP